MVVCWLYVIVYTSMVDFYLHASLFVPFCMHLAINSQCLWNFLAVIHLHIWWFGCLNSTELVLEQRLMKQKCVGGNTWEAAYIQLCWHLSCLLKYKCMIVDKPISYVRFARLKQHSNCRLWIVYCLKKYPVIPAHDPYINIHIPWCSLPCSLSGFHPLVRTEWAAHPPPAAYTGPRIVSEVPGHPVPSCHTAASYYNKETSLTKQC